MERKPSVFHVLLLAFTLIGMACDKDATSGNNSTCGNNGNQANVAENQDGSNVDCSLPVETPDTNEPTDDVADTPEEPQAPVDNGNDDDFGRAAEADLEINAYLRDFSTGQRSKMETALEKLKVVLNSEEFRQRVVNFTYNGRKQFVDNKGLTNRQIYDSILRGAETLNGIIDQEVDVDLTLYYSNNSTVGYTYPNTNRIWVNNKFFSTYTHGSVAANVAHEWLHKLGYGHDFERTTRRNYSVPYGVGGIVRELVNKL